MQFNKFDFFIILSMTLVLIAVNFTFPALGLTPTNTTQNDIPEFNVTQGTFDFVQTVPDTPSNPTEGTLTYIDDQTVYQDDRRVWLEGNTNGGFEVTLTNNGTLADPAASLFLNEYNSTGFVDADSTEMENTTEFDKLENGYIVTFENVTYSNVGDADLTITADWEIAQSPGGVSAVSQLPIIGGTLSAVAEAIGALGAVIGWVGTIAFNLAYNFVIASTNLARVVYNIITFFTGLGWWFITTYTSIIQNAPASWIQLILSIPGLLISLEFVKLIGVIKQQIPVLG